MYLVGSFSSIALAFPLFWLLQTKNETVITFAMIIVMTCTHALLFGPKAAFMPELFGTRVRYSGASLGANVAAAMSGGFSPLIATGLLAWVGASWPVSLYIMGLSLITVVATIAAPETAHERLKD
jgi:hypothetical protein